VCRNRGGILRLLRLFRAPKEAEARRLVRSGPTTLTGCFSVMCLHLASRIIISLASDVERGDWDIDIVARMTGV
jgi:hypothetical protein